MRTFRKLELCQAIQKHIPEFVFPESQIGEDPDKRNYIVSNTRIEGTGWKPAYSLDDGIVEFDQGVPHRQTETVRELLMIITQAPVRISFLGGGTDFPQHFEIHGGAVLATAIDRFAYVTIQKFHHQFFDHRLRISYRKTENPRNASEVEHPAIRACFQKVGIDEGAELHHMADPSCPHGPGLFIEFCGCHAAGASRV